MFLKIAGGNCPVAPPWLWARCENIFW